MAAVGDVDLRMRGERHPPRRRPGDREIAALATRQHGVVARRQLVAAAFGPSAIDSRIARGYLLPVHRGVYAVGHRSLGSRGRWLAAVLACGEGALLSHGSAAALWGIHLAAGSNVDVTKSGHRCRPRRGIALHRARRLEPSDCTTREGVPVTAISRTLLDLASVLRPRALERAIEAAERQRLFDLRALTALLDRSGGKAGVRLLRDLLAEGRDPPDVRSELERRFVGLCRKWRLPSPAVNVVVEGFEVDALWQEARVIVELDGFEYHRSRNAFERDRHRDACLQLAGYRVVRITWRRLERESHATGRLLRQLIEPGRSGRPGSGSPPGSRAAFAAAERRARTGPGAGGRTRGGGRGRRRDGG